MNRREEYNTLLAEMETPAELDAVVRQAMARERRRRTTRRLAVCACAPAVVLLVFVALVNLSSSFAYACGNLPGLRELARAVTFSPSLTDAVNHNYTQPIDQQQMQNGVTMRVEYVIVDRKQLNIFYTLNSQVYQHMDARPKIGAIDGANLQGYTIASRNFDESNGTLRFFTVDFVQGDMPSALQLRVDVHVLQTEDANQPPAQSTQTALPEEPQAVASFSFPLTFDPAFTQKGAVLPLNHAFRLDGQTLIADSVEIYPTHIRFNLKDEPSNTAWLKDLDFYLQDEKGRRFERSANGAAAMGTPDSPMMASYWLESPYFAQSKKLTLHITGATWLDKERQRTRVDLAHGTADWLPQGVKLERAWRDGGNWVLSFSGEMHKDEIMMQLFNQDYYDEKGQRYEVHEWSGRYDEKDKKRFIDEFALIDYPYDLVYLSPSFSYVTAQDDPVDFEVR